MLLDPNDELWQPTPLGTLMGSLVTAIVLATLVVLVLVTLRSGRDSGGQGGGARLLRLLRRLDHGFIRLGGGVLGNTTPQPVLRKVRVLAAFALLVAAGVAAPFLPAMAALTLGLLAILVLFRHWSRDEAERATGSTSPAVPGLAIQGDLTFEMAMASGVLLFIVPLAFARLHAAGYAFQLTEEAGPFAFVFYMFIELLKLGTVVDYYDLFADQIAFGRLQQAHHPAETVKYVMLLFRVIFDLIILVALKRMLDIARRISAGQDLRELRVPLGSADEDDDAPAITKLGALTKAGNGHALTLLEQVAHGELALDGRRTKLFSSELRLLAAVALAEAGAHAPAVAALEALENESAESDPDLHARVLEQLQTTRRELRRQTLERRLAQVSTEVEILRHRLQHMAAAPERAVMQQELARALRSMATLDRQPVLLREAAELLGQAQDSTPTATPEWARLRRDLGGVLRRLGERLRDADALSAAHDAYADALAVLGTSAAPHPRAALHYEMAQTLHKLNRLRPSAATLAAARAAIAAALVLRPGVPSWLALRRQLNGEAERSA